jgi:hypothetical protein
MEQPGANYLRPAPPAIGYKQDFDYNARAREVGMAEPAVRRTPASGTDQSIGDLVSAATRDISQLVRYEMDLAKIEMKSDVKRLGLGALGFVLGGFVACLMLVMFLFAYAYLLQESFHLPLSACFAIAGGTCLGLAVIAGGIGFILVRRMSGISKTRRSLREGLNVLRRRRPAAKAAAAKASASKADASKPTPAVAAPAESHGGATGVGAQARAG